MGEVEHVRGGTLEEIEESILRFARIDTLPGHSFGTATESVGKGVTH